MNPTRLLILVIVLSLTGGVVFAQTPALDAGAAISEGTRHDISPVG